MHILTCAQFFACSLAQNELDLRENQEEGESFFCMFNAKWKKKKVEGKSGRRVFFFFSSFVVGREGENLLFLFGIHRRKVGKSSLFL